MTKDSDDSKTTVALAGKARGSSADATFTLVPGTKVRDYVVERFIASGGFSSVYQVREDGKNRLCALKLLHPELRALGDAFLRFLREAHVLEKLRHESIVEVYDSGSLSDGRAYVVMEFLSGRDLDERIDLDGPLALADALAILQPICAALEHAHERGIVHRDVKASNVFLSEEGGKRRIVLLDFGLAKVMESGGIELTSSRMSLGTPASMAPEQIRGEAVSSRTDVYGLGALTYHMLTGRLPFDGSSRTVMQYMHLHGPRPRPSTYSNVSAAVDAVIARAMASMPEDRYATPREFLAGISEAAELPQRAQGAPLSAPRHHAFAVYVDVRIAPDITEEAEDSLLTLVESILEQAEQHLSQRGFAVGLEGSSGTLFVKPLSSDRMVERRERREAILAVSGLRQICDQVEKNHRALHINVSLHRDFAEVVDGEVVGGEILESERWAPERLLAGVVGSGAAFEGLDVEVETVADAEHLLRLRSMVPEARQGHMSEETSIPERGRERGMHTEMMAHLGRHVASIVHDLRSSLTVVIGNIDTVLQHMAQGKPTTEDDREALESAMTAAMQLRGLTASILSASAIRSYSATRRVIAVDSMVDNAVMLARGETRRKARVDVTHEGKHYVVGSQGQLTQAVVNLLVNAAQAIADYGRITIQTSGTGSEVHIAIRDTGSGMSAEVKERIFEPFFTTKDIGEGTGLGLSRVREIVEDHGGAIAVTSSPGVGSCFTIRLPASQRRPPV